MDEEKRKHQFEAALPLPGTSQQANGDDDSSNPAVELIRKRVEAAYANEPDAVAEAAEVEQLGPTAKLSKHQRFMNGLLNSGKTLVETQVAWHEYYQKLPDNEKHDVWKEFYAMHAASSRFAAATGQTAPPQSIWAQTIEPPRSLETHEPSSRVGRILGELRGRQKLQSLMFGLAAGAGAVLIVLFGFFNERFIAPFIQPSRNVTNTLLISDAAAVGTAPEIIIPKINVQIPVVYGLSSNDESVIQKALENGVVQYPSTSVPGQNGNVAIVGHSSGNIFNPGKYKFAFVLLSRLEKGDTFYLHKDGQRYTYQVYIREIVGPTDVSVLGPRDKPATASLITCDPPGTSTNRLVVVGEQIDPDPSSNSAGPTQAPPQPAKIPGNAESLWHRIWRWLDR